MRTTYGKYGKYIRAILTLVDLGLVNLIFGVTLLIYPQIAHSTTPVRELWVLANVSFAPIALLMTRDKVAMRAIQLDRVLLSALKAVGFHALFFLSLMAFLSISVMTSGQILVFYAMLGTAFSMWSIVSRYIIKAFRRRGRNFTRVVIVGTNATASRLYKELLSDAGFGYKILGCFDKEERPDFDGPVRGSLDDLEEFVRANGVDQIYFTMPGHDDQLTRVVKIADDNVVEFFYVPQISRRVSRGFELHSIGSMPVLSVRHNPLKSTINRFVKRASDVVFSSLFLVFYPLVYIPIALTIKLTSPGPVYFKQQRTGYKGKPFYCYKFRTMRVNADSDKAQATRDDPRKTRFGDFLRRSSLDELPQFINVLKGEMSIVGPRPHMLKHTEDYSKLIDKYMVRHLVKPGITGWAQVNGYRGITDQLWKMERRVEYDVWYIEHWSLLLDLKIMARTVMNAVRGESNAF